MSRNGTRADKIMRAVLQDRELLIRGDYDPNDYCCVEDALESDNPVVRAVGLILDRDSKQFSPKEIYKELTDYLKKEL